MNVFFIRAIEQIFSFGERWSASINGTFHLSPNENICSTARMKIHVHCFIQRLEVNSTKYAIISPSVNTTQLWDVHVCSMHTLLI